MLPWSEEGQVAADTLGFKSSFKWCDLPSPAGVVDLRSVMLSGSKPRKRLKDFSEDFTAESMTRIELCPGLSDWWRHQRGSRDDQPAAPGTRRG